MNGRLTWWFSMVACLLVCYQLKGAAAEDKGYLVVTNAELKKSLPSFLEWKKSNGFRIEVETIDEKNLTVEDVRKRILNAYNTWKNPSLDYVLLVGDESVIPAESKKLGKQPFVSDLVYSTLAGEDFFPDVGLGRLPVRTVEEAKIIFDKIIWYEKGDFKSKDWIGRASFITPKDFYEQCEDISNYCIKLTKQAGITGSFPKKDQPGGDQLYAATQKADTPDLIKAFNEGRGLVFYQGHAIEDRWQNPQLTTKEIPSIKTEDARPFVVSISCLSGCYNQPTDCLGEAWIKHKNGAVAFFGATANSLFPHCLFMQKGVADAIFKQGKVTLSDICNEAKLSMHKSSKGQGSRLMYEMYHLFGDPSMKLRLPSVAK